jgi:hypothetical protein
MLSTLISVYEDHARLPALPRHKFSAPAAVRVRPQPFRRSPNGECGKTIGSSDAITAMLRQGFMSGPGDPT